MTIDPADLRPEARLDNQDPALFGQTPGILHGCLRIMNGARTDHDDQTIPVSMENVVHGLTRAMHCGRGGQRAGKFVHHMRRGGQLTDLSDADVVSIV